jgi:translocation protein SEC72
MATAASDIDLDTYTHLPLQIDPASKTLSLHPSASANTSLQEALNTINHLHTTLKTLDTPNSIPPPPVPNNLPTQKRTAQISKLREAASTAYRKSQFPESIRLYTFAIDMAAGRPSWEPVGLIREELSGLYRDRAQAHMGIREWVEGWKDCEASVECKRPQGEKGKVWFRGGKCLLEMARYGEAVDWLERGVDCEGGLVGEDGREMRALLAEVKRKAEQFSG